MLYINIRSLPKSVKSVFPSKYTKKYEINFDNVYLLEKDPMAKVIKKIYKPAFYFMSLTLGILVL